MLVVCVMAQKGGVGKTTLAVQMLITAWLEGLAGCMIDLDEQGSGGRWGELRAQTHGLRLPAIVRGKVEKLDDMLAAARRTKTEIAFLDTPPAINKTTVLCAAAADVILLPTRAAVLDEISLEETLQVLKAAKAIEKTVIVINALEDGQKADVASVRRIAAKYGATVLKAAIESDPVYRSSMRDGKGVAEVAPKSKAAKQLKTLLRVLRQRAVKAEVEPS